MKFAQSLFYIVITMCMIYQFYVHLSEQDNIVSAITKHHLILLTFGQFTQLAQLDSVGCCVLLYM